MLLVLVVVVLILARCIPHTPHLKGTTLDFSQAALLIAAVFAVTKLADKIVPALVGWKLQLAALVIGIGTTFLVAYSSYASSVSVGGQELDKVNTAALLLIGLMLAGGATVVDQGFKAVTNVGENQNQG